jgi:xanthine dehydrogenase YagS FAD-binding subunit
VNAFRFARAHDVASATATVGADPRAKYVAGGTNVVDLMK